MVIINKSTDNKYWQGCGKKGTLLHCWWECRLVRQLWKKLWKNGTALWSSNSTSRYISKKIQNTTKRTYAPPLFTIAKIWKQPKYSSMDEWVKKLWYIYTMKYYLATKRWNFTICNSMDEPKRYYAKWDKLVNERQIPYDFIYMWNLRNGINKQNRNRLIGKDDRLMVPEERRVGVVSKKHEGIKKYGLVITK